MSQAVWRAVDSYIAERLVGEEPALEAALAASETAGLPPMAVSPNEGKFLELLARVQQARCILELGTLGGYSTIWLARALPKDGRLVTLEHDPTCAAVARRNIANAGLNEVVEIRIGSAAERLRQLHSEGSPPFDLIFIDADKPRIPDYYARALALSHPGSVIVVDNVVRDGRLADASSDDANVQGVRAFHELLAHGQRVSATTIQTVGGKGYDGFTLALVT